VDVEPRGTPVPGGQGFLGSSSSSDFQKRTGIVRDEVAAYAGVVDFELVKTWSSGSASSLLVASLE
jgi:hypothetical protein